jgi:uncharacterized protein (DUF1778 family)
MPSDTSRNARLEARIAPDALAVVRRAAEIQGRSVSDFVVAAAHEAAQRTIEQAQIIKLSLKAQRRFVDLLLNPPAPAAALKRARKAHAKLIVD